MVSEAFMIKLSLVYNGVFLCMCTKRYCKIIDVLINKVIHPLMRFERKEVEPKKWRQKGEKGERERERERERAIEKRDIKSVREEYWFSE